MINIVDKTKCCGCTACANICPANCISMKEDNEGFLYPKADANKCIGCGACDRVCPVLNYNKKISFDQKAYLVQNKDKEVLKDSTSGGAFSEIARYVIKQGGIVYGVEMTEDLIVQHTAIENEKDIGKFRNSKYVQSYLGYTFQNIKEQLETERMVCFSGTPCQCEGLLHFLGRKPDNLVLCDICCRAVPSPGMWKKFSDSVKKQYGEIRSARFRDKKLGYQYSTMAIETENGELRDGIESAPWLRMFFSGMITRPSCSECKFRSPYRHSDITIWDCFPTYRIAPEFDENVGTTRILIQSKKGQVIFNSIEDSFKCKEMSVEEVSDGVYEMHLSHPENSTKKKFFVDNESMPMGYLLDKYFPETTKVKIKKNIRRELNKIGLDKKLKHILRK